VSLPPRNRPFARLPLSFDAAGLRADLASIAPAAWSPHLSDRVHTGECTAVILRSKTGAVDDLAAWGTAHEFRDTPLLAQCPHLKAAIDAFLCEKKSVRLVRLHAGSSLRSFRAADLGVTHHDLRIHIPIATSSAVELIVADMTLAAHAGQAWHIALGQPCRFVNRGAVDCLFLVIDAVINDWAIAMLDRAAQEIVSESSEPLGAASFRAFRELVFDDPALQARLVAITQPDRFLEAVVSAGAELGFAFDALDVESARNRGHRDWMMRTVAL
jgi:hypothetical protein